MDDSTAEQATAPKPFDSIPRDVWDDLDVFAIMELAAKRNVLGKVVVDEEDPESGKWQRIREYGRKFDFETLAADLGEGSYRCQVARRGAPGGNLATRYVEISPRAVPHESQPALQAAPPARAPAPFGAPAAQAPAAPSPLGDDPRLHAMQEQIDAMKADNERLKREALEREHKLERERLQDEVDALRQSLADMRNDLRQAKPVQQAPDTSRELALMRRIDELTDKMIAQSMERASSDDPLEYVLKKRELYEQLFDTPAPEPEKKASKISEWADLASVLVEKGAPHVKEIVAEYRRNATSQGEAPAQKQIAQEDTMRAVDEFMLPFLSAVADSRDKSPNASLRAGVRAVCEAVADPHAAPAIVDEVLGELQPWTLRDYAKPGETQALEDHLMQFVPRALRPMVRPKLRKPETVKHVLGVLRELKRWADGVQAGDEAVISEMQEVLAA